VLRAVGAVAGGRHRAAQSDARRADRGREVQRAGVARDQEPREPAQFAEVLQRRLRGDDRGAARLGRDAFGRGPLRRAGPGDERGLAVPAGERPRRGGEAILGPALRRPARAWIEQHGRLRHPQFGEPLFHPQPAHGPRRHVEGRCDGRDAQRREQFAIAIDHVLRPRPHEMRGGQPGGLARDGPRRADPHGRTGEPRGDAALEQALQIDRRVGAEPAQGPRERQHLPRRLEPAPGQAEEMVDRRMAGEHVGRPALDDPADPRRGKPPPQGDGDRHAVEDVADRGELDDDDRAWVCHGRSERGRGR
jgi:hypothetical protein